MRGGERPVRKCATQPFLPVSHAYCLKQLRPTDRAIRDCPQQYVDMRNPSKSVAFQVGCCAAFDVSS